MRDKNVLGRSGKAADSEGERKAEISENQQVGVEELK